MGIESEYIYGQTPLNLDEQDGLLVANVRTRGDLDELEQLNIEKALIWTMGSSFTENILTEQFVRKLHKRMFGDVWCWAGTYRKSEKNIGVDWTLIGVEVRKLIDDMKFWIENETFETDEAAIRFKHRLVTIHCFPNGNGRHARLMSDLIMEEVFHKEAFSWGDSMLTEPGSVRETYINAIKQADRGNIAPLIAFARS
jgi:Fic-DOC domain mobile mystery protein B